MTHGNPARRRGSLRLAVRPFRLMPMVLALALSLGACAAAQLDPPSARLIRADAEEVVNTREIVVLTPSAEAADSLARKARPRGYRLLSREYLSDMQLVMLIFQRPEGLEGAAAIRELEGLEPRATAGVNHRYRLQSGHDAGARHYAAALIAWPEEGCPAFVSIGMIDGPLDMSAPGLMQADIVRAHFARGRPGDPGQDQSHGTAIAQLLVGPGRLSGATLFSAQVVSGTVPPQESPGDPYAEREGAGVPEIVRALNWLQGQGAKVVNISLAGPYNKILEIGVEAVLDKGMIIVAAAGNAGSGSPPRYPAGFDDVIAVTALDQALTLYEHAVRGRHIDIAAPGVDVYVETGKGGRYVSGTSVASPFVTARIAADRKSLGGRREEMKESLASTAQDIGARGHDPEFGFGLMKAPGDCRAPEAF